MNKHFAVDASGKKHTRNSQNRIYTHTVVAQRSYDEAVRDINAAYNAKYDRRHHAHNVEQAALVDEPNAPDWQVKNNASYRAQAKKFLATYGPDPETYVAAMHAERVADVAEKKAAGYYDEWCNVGWCSRLDLALKLAQSTEGKPYWKNARVLTTHVK